MQDVFGSFYTQELLLHWKINILYFQQIHTVIRLLVISQISSCKISLIISSNIFQLFEAVLPIFLNFQMKSLLWFYWYCLPSAGFQSL